MRFFASVQWLDFNHSTTISNNVTCVPTTRGKPKEVGWLVGVVLEYEVG